MKMLCAEVCIAFCHEFLIDKQKMEDTKLLAALITAIVSLIIGTGNLVFSFYSVRARKKSEFELEKLKSDLDMSKLKYENDILMQSEKEKFEDNIKRRILSDIQKFKDSIYSLIYNSRQKSLVYVHSIRDSLVRANTLIGTYQETYMDIEDANKVIFHKFKNMMHGYVTDLSTYIDLYEVGFESKNLNESEFRVGEKKLSKLLDSLNELQENIIN